MDTCQTCGGAGAECRCGHPDLMAFLSAFRETPPAAPPVGTVQVVESGGLVETPPPVLPPPPALPAAGPEPHPGPPSVPAATPPDVDPAAQEWPQPVQYWTAPFGSVLPSPPRPVRRTGVWAAAAGVVALALIAAVVAVLVVPSGPSLNGLSGASVMQKTLAAATKAGSAHVVASQVQDGQVVTGTIDFSSSGGTETLTTGSHTMTVLYAGGSLYMRADAGLLAQNLGVSGSVADLYADQWITLPTDDPALQQMAGELQTSVVVSDLLTLAGTITRGGTHGPGQVAVQGKLAANEYNDGSGAGDLTTLTVSTRAPFYPAAISYSDPQNGTTRLTFSQWGERVDLQPPVDPVPIGDLGLGGNTGAPAAPDESTAPAPSITATSAQSGLAVTPEEAQTVGAQLWNAWVQARATRDATALQTLDMQPMLAADWGYICQFDCHGPELTLSALTATVPRQAKWPADFLANATYTPCQTPITPCDDTFVAVQAAPGAAWKIASMADWTGTSYASTPPVGPGQLSPDPTPPAGADVAALPEAYAQYLQAIKTTGAPPAVTRLAAGPFTSGLIQANYFPASEQQAQGLVETTTYRVDPSDPTWQFAGSNGTTEVCGTVRFTDVRKETTIPLVQSAADHPYGDLAAGVYSSITMTGLHLVCFEVYPDPAKPVAVVGTWGETVTATGTPIEVQTDPA